MSESELLLAIKNLNRDRNPNIWDGRTKGGAPHKPILLLSILDAVENGWISSNKFHFSNHISETFFDYWDKIFPVKKKTTIALPLYHMKSESFWKLNYRRGVNEFNYSPSIGALADRVESFELDDELFQMMSDQSGNQKIRFAILEVYFSDEVAKKITDAQKVVTQSYSYSNSLLALAAEPFYVQHKIGEEVFRKVKKQVRNKGFSRVVRHNYNDTCSICGDRVKTPEGRSLADAAHIIPWSKSKNDDPRNGISLCKSHHWMFDQYLITINENYVIQFSKHLTLPQNEITNLQSRKGKEIILPEEEQFFPAIEALEYHNELYEKAQVDWR